MASSRRSTGTRPATTIGASTESRRREADSPMTSLVQLDGVARRFGSGHTEVTALHPTSLGVQAGELLAVMGPSGSGKTTLLSLIGGLDRPTEGRVTVAGQDVGSLKSIDLAILRRRTVGYVFQDLNLLAGLTARENVA